MSSALPEPVKGEVTLGRTGVPPTPDEILWFLIKERSAAISFNDYKNYMDSVLLNQLGRKEREEREEGGEEEEQEGAGTGDWGAFERLVDRANAYDVLKLATELYLMVECGIIPSQSSADKIANALNWNTNEETDLFKLPKESEEQIKKELGASSEQLRERYFERLKIEGAQAKDLVLPYYKLIIERLRENPEKPLPVVLASYDYGILANAAASPPMIELIWSYWHEQGMVIQTMAAAATRFQNRRLSTPDPLAALNLDPLRGASNLLWGWIQDERNRLTVQRRAYEYEHQYGLSLVGRAVPRVEPVDSRSKFLRCFHELLGLCVKFYEADDDTTVVADPFPVLNGLKEVHMVLAEGAHNQFGDLPWQSRVEIMVMQWILARPEFREFLGGRTMVPYEEPWMDRVDAMRQMQGWGDTSVSQFRDLGVYGEQILLSIRYGNWMTNSSTPMAANWARRWREAIQIYVHAYRTVTGVDLTAEPVDARSAEARFAQPSAYLLQQEQARRQKLRLPAPATRA